jgi:hypothetical protein
VTRLPIRKNTTIMTIIRISMAIGYPALNAGISRNVK